MTNIPSIAQLQSDWFKFSDLDRAGAVLAIHQSGISIRKIAAQLRLSKALLRHLLQTLQAPACDQDLARQGKISTNELVRHAKAGLRTAKHHETIIIDRNRETRLAADLICGWLLQTQLFGPARKMMVKEVQRKFRIMKEAGLRPSAVAPHLYPLPRSSNAPSLHSMTASTSLHGILSGSAGGPSSPFPIKISGITHWSWPCRSSRRDNEICRSASGAGFASAAYSSAAQEMDFPGRSSPK